MAHSDKSGAWAPDNHQAVLESVPESQAGKTLCETVDSENRPERNVMESSFLFPEWTRRTSVRLFGPLVLKGVASAALLSAVAWLGHYSKTETHYGKQVESSPALGAPEGSWKQLEERRAASEPAPIPATVAATPRCPKAKPKSVGLTPDGKVILNEATAEELTRLPGVGKSRAEAIVKLRDRLGRFKKVSDLLRIRGIGWRTLKKMKDLAVVNGPAPSAKPTGPVGSKENGSGGKTVRRATAT